MELLYIRLSQASAKRRKMSTMSSHPLLLHLGLEVWIDPLHYSPTLLFYPVDRRQGSNPQAPALQSGMLPLAEKTHPRADTITKPKIQPEILYTTVEVSGMLERGFSGMKGKKKIQH